jgi:hypothetical protein
MKTLTQELVIGLLAAAFVSCVVNVANAAPPPHQKWIPGYPTPWWLPGPHPGPHPWPHPGPHPGSWIPPVVIYHPRPYIVERVTTPYYVDASNPTPVADIRIVNPPENRVALKYSLNGGAAQVIEPGTSVQINQQVVIAYDRGGNMGRERFSLTDGTYVFKPTNGGYWRLFRESDVANATPIISEVASNPLPAK